MFSYFYGKSPIKICIFYLKLIFSRLITKKIAETKIHNLKFCFSEIPQIIFLRACAPILTKPGSLRRIEVVPVVVVRDGPGVAYENEYESGDDDEQGANGELDPPELVLPEAAHRRSLLVDYGESRN